MINLLIGISIGIFISTIYFNVEIGKHCSRMMLATKSLGLIAVSVEMAGLDTESRELVNIADTIYKECE